MTTEPLESAIKLAREKHEDATTVGQGNLDAMQQWLSADHDRETRVALQFLEGADVLWLAEEIRRFCCLKTEMPLNTAAFAEFVRERAKSTRARQERSR